ncbi:MAG: flagellar accessory protein FlaH [Desulfurococcales archaeon ex4484_217_1]|nr:MAG: flagellar accessory protein FlaH [Desulfurococcales archaeon ex4484_217_1]
MYGLKNKVSSKINEEIKGLKGYVLSTGNGELDMRLGGGIPVPNLLSIEGGHGTGKSILVQQITYGAVRSNKRVIYVTTEAGVRELIMQTRKVSLDLTEDFLKGLIRVVPVHLEGIKWTKNVAKKLLRILGDYMAYMKDEYDIFIVDSFSVLAVYADISIVLNFLTKVRTIVREGKLIILTLHPSVLPEDVMVRVKAISDSYIKLDFAEIGGRLVKVMRIIKIRGASEPADSTIAFDVDPAFGIKVVPLALAKA